MLVAQTSADARIQAVAFRIISVPVERVQNVAGDHRLGAGQQVTGGCGLLVRGHFARAVADPATGDSGISHRSQAFFDITAVRQLQRIGELVDRFRAELIVNCAHGVFFQQTGRVTVVVKHHLAAFGLLWIVDIDAASFQARSVNRHAVARIVLDG